MKLGNLKTIKNSLIEAIYPTRCALCDSEYYLLCPQCIAKINMIDQLKACQKCGEPYGKIQCCNCTNINTDKNEYTSSNQNHAIQIKSFCILDQNSGRIITLYKDSGEQRLSKVIAYFLYKTIPQAWTKNKETIISFIPSTKESIDRRGFDHCELIAKALGQYTKLKVAYLFKNPKSKDMRNLNREQRQKNINDGFQLINESKIKTLLNNMNIILIDDVFTTGATLKKATNTLYINNISTIYCITFARAY